MVAPPLIVFDVNETLLDLTTMEPTFERIFGDKGAMRLWFANFIMYSSALTVAGCYVPFTDIGSAVMKMLADTRGIRIEDADKTELVEKFSTMPPHTEVPTALQKLRAAGFRLFTLTDNLLEVQKRKLEPGGIVDFLVQTPLSITSPRGMPMPMLRGSSGLTRLSSVLSLAIHGTPLAPSLRAGRPP
jgi:2-haloacid dehalogenase